MRVLQVNKFFHPRAGAETSFLQTRTLLRERGHDVIDFGMRHPDNLDSPYSEFFAPERTYADGGGVRRVADGLSSVYSWPARRALGALVEAHRPDVAHLHNVYHQLTVSVIDELAARSVPMVLTLHDWKVACPAYTLFTEGAPCRRCPQHGVSNVIRHRCVKDSRAASALAAVEATVTKRRHTYDKVQQFVAPSRFAVDVAGLGGISQERVAVIPNFLPDHELQPLAPSADAGPRFVYAGRLEATKGIRQLLSAFEQMATTATLRVIGGGELKGEVEQAAARDPRIEYLGRVPREQVLAEFGNARAVLLPSIWEDNGPFVVLEAQAQGKPMIVSDRGGLQEFVQHERTGLVVDPEDPDELRDAMTRMAARPDEAQEWGAQARQRVETHHSAPAHYDRLLGAYTKAIGREASGRI